MPIFQRLQAPISTQVMDLRSQVMKEAISLLKFLAQEYPVEFAHNSHKFINAEANSGGSLFRQLNNGKRVLADIANEGITFILETVCLPK